MKVCFCKSENSSRFSCLRNDLKKVVLGFMNLNDKYNLFSLENKAISKIIKSENKNLLN